MILCGAIQGVKSSVRINMVHLTFVFSFSWFPPITRCHRRESNPQCSEERSISGCRVCPFHHGDVVLAAGFVAIERAPKPRVMPLEPDGARTGEARRCSRQDLNLACRYNPGP